MQKIVDVQNVEKIYGKAGEKQFKALSDVNFEVKPGEFVGIMGASGSGKTTLLNILSTLDTPTSGQVEIAGEDITKLNNNQMADFRANKIGFIFQDFNLLENLTAYENIALPLALQNTAAKKIKPAVQSIAEKLGLTDILNHYPTELSGGQKQRVAAARALVHEPSIVFGDEPTGALDSKSARALLDTLTKINREDNVSILLVTHDPFSASFCDRILFIKDGEIGQELKKEENSRAEFYQEILDSLGTFAE
ncbi:ABC transporter, ATP-binding protein [Companilactobacillus paralimentarius DSM 13238 = JCM 10415]|jgi:ABC-type antimicrobial peptide transport system, ATPase component|uniref:ABC transporter, ATP-binding protein n=3 Tax=Companilactobacillus TaxID=2767879 RepID=A0ABR5NVB1_9LACO|nr:MULTISPECIES: ABC transporter ATP-binding protein [Companilactobacillus]KAE9558154.1 bacitracin ABC transporter ATP-binding protein [Companilactobacillus kimchii]KAE9558199.1 bacitracin ABC transporter ATP-binding protein [Companilactobacillus paralimentarius]KRK52811.1 ABC transporter, ATP-binding protein [Companilactobacillus kimchii DSM 13961 = JCM 10707]KRL32271.1 ABC transporter, ATP-binding protein [Companilactobacillus paralimentarius DSM 13238 = JCM 10415]MDR4932696.1 ABC transporte